MDNTTFFLYGVAGDAQTVELLELAAKKGVSLALRDIRRDPKAELEFLGRGLSVYPVMFHAAGTFMGGYDQAIIMFNRLPDLKPATPPAQVTLKPTEQQFMEEMRELSGETNAPAQPASTASATGSATAPAPEPVSTPAQTVTAPPPAADLPAQSPWAQVVKAVPEEDAGDRH